MRYFVFKMSAVFIFSAHLCAIFLLFFLCFVIWMTFICALNVNEAVWATCQAKLADHEIKQLLWRHSEFKCNVNPVRVQYIDYSRQWLVQDLIPVKIITVLICGITVLLIMCCRKLWMSFEKLGTAHPCGSHIDVQIRHFVQWHFVVNFRIWRRFQTPHDLINIFMWWISCSTFGIRLNVIKITICRSL